MKNINRENYLYIEGDESGHMSNYPTLWDVYKGMREIKEFDKRHSIKDNYHIIWCCKGIDREIKITRRGNKLYWKVV